MSQHHDALHPASSPPSSLTLRVLTWMAIGVLLFIGKAAFAPLLFAILLALLLSPVVDVLVRWHLPRALASLLSVAVLLSALAGVVDAAWAPALRWVDDAPAILQKIERKIRPLQRSLARVESVTTRANSITTPGSAGAKNAPAPSDDAPERMSTLAMSRVILIDIATVTILTVFLLINGANMLRRIEFAVANRSHRYESMRVLDAVRSELSRYFATLTLINIGLGLVVAGVMALWGLPNPWLWGITAGILNFIPYAGPTLSLVVMTVVALVSFDGYGVALGVAASFIGIATIEGQIVQPLLVGYRLNLNPTVLFVTIWLAGWFWGVSGVLLATPVLITLKEIANRQERPSVLKAILLAQPNGSDPPTEEKSKETELEKEEKKIEKEKAKQ